MSQFGEVIAPARLFAMQRFIVASAAIVLVAWLVSLLRGWYLLLLMPAWHNGFFAFLVACASFCLSYAWIAIKGTRILRYSADRFYKYDDSLSLKKAALEESCRQITFWGFLGGSFFILSAAAFYPHGVGDWIVGWLVSCARDANIYPDVAHQIYLRGTDGYWLSNRLSALSAGPDLGLMVKIATAFCFCWLPFKKLLTASSLMVSFVGRAADDVYKNQTFQALIDTLNADGRTVAVKDRHPVLSDVLRSLKWLILCYLALFWLVAFCPGWLGATIGRFLEFSVRSAHLTGFDSGLRIFLAAVVGVYATVPVAVMTSVFLPARKPATIAIMSDGLLFSASYMVPLQFRLLRALNDLWRVELKVNEKNHSHSVLSISFRSGGTFSCRLAQLVDKELLELLFHIYENARECSFDGEVLALKSKLAATYGSPVSGALALKYSPQIERPKRSFRPTLFVPHSEGCQIKDGLSVVKLLATQSFSVTYLARKQDSEGSNLCIVKQYFGPSNSALASQAIEALDHDYAMAKEALDDCIPKVYDSFQIGDSKYFCAEYVDGASLRKILTTRGIQSEAQTVNWALQLAELIVRLQEQNKPVLLRDITPDNIVMERTGKLRFVNFGAAREFNRIASGAVNGSLSYIAPEYLRGALSPSSQIYSFGCVLAFMLSGVDPLALTSVDLSNSATKHSQWLVEFVRRCTSVDEQERPDSFSSIVETLTSTLDNRHVNLSKEPSITDGANTAHAEDENGIWQTIDSNQSSTCEQDKQDRREPVAITMDNCDEVAAAIKVMDDSTMCTEVMERKKNI